MSKSVSKTEMLEIHKKSIFIDLHADTACPVAEWRLRGETKVLEKKFWSHFQASGLTSRIIATGGDSPFYATYPTKSIWPPRDSLRRLIVRFDAILQDIEESPDKFIIADNAGDIIKAKKENKVAFILSIEGCRAFEHDISMMRLLYRLGLRNIQFTHSYRNFLADGFRVRNPGGLTDLGIEAVDEANKLGIIIDICHMADKGIWDVLETSKQPILCSHTHSLAIEDLGGYISDDLMKTISEKDGLIGLSMTGPNFDTWLRHLEHMIDVAGIDHVGVGSDLNENLPRSVSTDIWGTDFQTRFEELRGHSGFPNLTKSLLERGYSEKETFKVLGENFLRLFRKIRGK